MPGELGIFMPALTQLSSRPEPAWHKICLVRSVERESHAVIAVAETGEMQWRPPLVRQLGKGTVLLLANDDQQRRAIRRPAELGHRIAPAGELRLGVLYDDAIFADLPDDEP